MAKPAKMAKTPSLEASLTKLDAIVEKLESGNLSLDDSLKQFEEGVKLTKECQKILHHAEQKIKILSENNELEDFNEGNDE